MASQKNNVIQLRPLRTCNPEGDTERGSGGTGTGSAAKALLPLLGRRARERFRSKFVSRGADECWPWNASRSAKGYGRFHLGDSTRQAHHVSYVMYRGEEVPMGYEIDHTCNAPWCVNPAHLVAKTPGEHRADQQHTPRDAEARQRMRAHWNGDPLTPLPREAGVGFLVWVWRTSCEFRGYAESEIPRRSAEWNALRLLLESARNDEATAALALWAVVWDWPRYRGFASQTYDRQQVPERPLLSALKGPDGVTSVLAFWRSLPEARGRESWSRLGPGYWVRRMAITRECDRLKAEFESRCRCYEDPAADCGENDVPPEEDE